MNLTFPLLLCFIFITSTSLHAETVVESSTARATLLELYTSEGCSSCPPADFWISQFKNKADLWTKIVPVVFHVDYWDNLGWVDSFASPLFTQRQREYSAIWGKRSVYTPCFVVNGKEWRGWFQSQTIPPPSSSPAGKLRAILNSSSLTVTFENPAQSPIQVETALRGNDLEIAVLRGENGGKKLAHNFVALHLDQKEMSNKTVNFALPPETVKKASAFAVWVRNTTTHEILQAVGGPIQPPL
jgi:hypothetical protein